MPRDAASPGRNPLASATETTKSTAGPGVRESSVSVTQKASQVSKDMLDDSCRLPRRSSAAREHFDRISGAGLAGHDDLPVDAPQILVAGRRLLHEAQRVLTETRLELETAVVGHRRHAE